MTLLEDIKIQSKSFKWNFLTQYRKAVVEELNKLNERYDLNTVYKQVEKETGVSNIYHTRKEYLKAERIADILRLFKMNKIQAYIDKEVLEADKQFCLKQAKLADRLIKKDVEGEIKLRINSSYPNLEGVVQAKDKQVSFYTIVASGQIQRPHYRYLIK